MDQLLTAKQVQDRLRVDRTTVYRMLKDGRLTGVKVGQQWRFSAQEIENLLSGSIGSSEKDVPVSADVLPLHCVQPIQDVFAEIAEVGAVLTDEEGQPLTKISNSCDFCKLILGSEAGRQGCLESWHELAQQKGGAVGFIPCHAGLMCTSAPIEVRSKRVAVFIAGQFHTQTPDVEGEANRIQALSEKYRIGRDLLEQAASSVSALDERKESQLAEWLQRVARTFEQIGSERADLMHRLKQISVMSTIDS
jgi:excisionase family DNA binding protein